MRHIRLLPAVAFLLLSATTTMAQSGKIAGSVFAARSGIPLEGANVVLEGTGQGSVADKDGYYAILNVRPGTHSVRASFVGYTPLVSRDVEVFVDLTTEIDHVLSEEVFKGDEVIVAARHPIVRRDVSASVVKIGTEEMASVPITDIDKIVGFQAGFEHNLTVRGFGGDQVQWIVDGHSMASGLHNEPFAAMSYTAVQEIYVQTGGFNAEYGNVRSGLINVITKEPDVDRYFVDAIVRYSPVSPSTFSGTDVDGQDVGGPESRHSFHLRPMFDPEVAMEGVSSWPTWRKSEYRTWSGWNELAEKYNRRNGTAFAGLDLQSVFGQHYLRKESSVNQPDYEVDATVGGPVPALSNLLGDLRFVASYRHEQQPYPISGYARDSFTQRLIHGKLISTFLPGMKLVVQGLYGTEDGLNRSPPGSLQQLTTGEVIRYPWQPTTNSMLPRSVGQDFNLGELLTDAAFELMDVDRLMLGVKLTHALSAKTFYEVQMQGIRTDYHTREIGPRDESNLSFSYLDGQIVLDSQPFGCSRTSRQDVLGIGIGMDFCSGRHDNSSIQRLRGRLDFASQVNRFILLKAGVEYTYSDFDVDYGDFQAWRTFWDQTTWRRRPQQAAAYAQGKLEFAGMIANLGLRLDYFHAGGDWFVHEDFERAFSAAVGFERLDEVLDKVPTKRLSTLSPRLGVSFPITNNAKLYFNYGHFRTMLDPVALFTIQRFSSGAVLSVGDPNHPMPRTVAYELGFEQNLFDQYHLRLAAYYRDLSKDPREVTFVGVDDLVDYVAPRPWNYADVRGFEATLTRRSGKWVRGFINYSFMARKTGGFGFARFDENRTAMANYVISSTDHYVSAPIPEPYARLNLEVLLPNGLGPRMGNTHPLGDWRITFLGEWRKGQSMTWNGQSLVAATGGSADRAIRGNVSWQDYYMLDMRISRNFATRFGTAQVFVDVANLLRIRHLYLSGGRVFSNGVSDLQDYMKSLHLPEEIFPEGYGGEYPRVFGDDQPGDFRKPGVAYVPIIVGSLPADGDGTRPLYYVPDEDTYYQWNGSEFAHIRSGSTFTVADGRYVDQVLGDKAYINMPNLTWGTFLNPRNIFFGVRLSF